MSEKKYNFEKKKSEDNQRPKKIQRLRLCNPKDVRRYIAKLMLRVENGEIEESKARLLNNLAESILKSIRADEIEKRIVEIENTLQEQKQEQDQNNDDDDFFLKKVK